MNYNFTQKGKGKTILLVHGWGGKLASMSKLQDILSKNYLVYNLELPGHGDSEMMQETWSTKNFQNYIESFITQENIVDFTYIGHSFGGHLGMRMSIDSELKPNKLILINSSGLKPKNSTKKIIWKIVSFVLKPLLNTLLFPIKDIIRTIIYKYVVRETDYLKTTGVLKESFKKIINEHLKNSQISKIKSPSLLIWGEYDTYTPLWMGHHLNQTIQNSTLEVIEGKHGVPFQQPQIVSKIILSWLDKIS